MKRLFYIVALASIVMLPLGASAQEHVNKAIDAFGTAVEKNGIKSSTVDKGNTKAYAILIILGSTSHNNIHNQTFCFPFSHTSVHHNQPISLLRLPAACCLPTSRITN